MATRVICGLFDNYNDAERASADILPITKAIILLGYEKAPPERG